MKTKSCLVCKEPFNPRTSDVTCSIKCRKQHANNKAKQWHQDNLEYAREYKRNQSKRHRRSNPEQRLLAGAKTRAFETMLSFNIDIEDIVIPLLCPILQVPMVIGGRYAPSLDRIFPEKGYTKGNVWVISRKANVMKNDATLDELERFRSWLNSQPL